MESTTKYTGVPGEVRTTTKAPVMWRDKVPGEDYTPIPDRTTRKPTKRPVITPGMIPGEGIHYYNYYSFLE